MDNAIDIRDLCVVYSRGKTEVRALDHLSLQVPQGQVVGFLGPNGAGKTTTIHILLGFVEASSGSACLFGEDVRRSIARRRIGYLPERPDFYRFMTGSEMLTMTGRLFGLGGALLRERMDRLLTLTEMHHAAGRRIGTYSRGMMQRIGLAQALINDPDLVMLDEPTSGLDPIGKVAVRTIIDGLRQEGKTIFFSSHEMTEVERVCDSVVVIAQGRLVARGALGELVRPGQGLESYFLETVMA